MENKVDKKGILNTEIFTYKIAKDNKVFISWNGKQVITLSGSKANKFITDIDSLESKDAQLVMAKVTGHFKHGNEKSRKTKK